MKWKYLTYASAVIIVIVCIKWINDSADYGETLIFTRDSKAIETIETDELFGTETIQTEWQEGIWLGLLPGDDELSIGMVIGVVPIAGMFFVLGAAGVYLEFRKKKLANK